MERGHRSTLAISSCIVVMLAFAGLAGCGTSGSSGRNPGVPGTPSTPQNAAARFVYALDATQLGNSSVAGFNFNSSTGMLTPMAGSPFSTSPFGSAMAATPHTGFVYVADWRN